MSSPLYFRRLSDFQTQAKGAVIQMKVGDYFVQGRSRWIRILTASEDNTARLWDVPAISYVDATVEPGIYGLDAAWLSASLC